MASTPTNRSTRDAAPIREFGFATKLEAIDAERVRRVEEQKKLERKKAGAAGVAAAMPTTLAMLLAEFMKQHAEEKLSPTTVEGYHKMIEYLAPELLAMNMTEITPLHLSREWARLVKSGGHSRITKAPRAMKPKTVRNIAGLVSSAFARAIKWWLVISNPVTHSDLPKVRNRIGKALLPAEQDRLMQCARGPWCLPAMLEMATATGARRGEVLALRWSDIKGTDIFIDRSLCQTKEGLVFKGTKTDEPRKVGMPPSLVACLEAHRLRQNEFRQFGPAYRSDLDLIFANPDGSPLMPNSVSSTVARLCRKLGLPKGASLHVLRHYLPFRTMSCSGTGLCFLRGAAFVPFPETPSDNRVTTSAVRSGVSDPSRNTNRTENTTTWTQLNRTVPAALGFDSR